MIFILKKRAQDSLLQMDFIQVITQINSFLNLQKKIYQTKLKSLVAIQFSPAEYAFVDQ